MGREAKRRAVQQEGRTKGSYTAWPHACARSASFASLSMFAKALLLEFLGQFTGYNNGDLSCAFALVKDRGWNSRTTVEKARIELEERGWIVRTRQGWRNKPNLYALTIFKIDEIAKLDVRGTIKPLGFWKDGSNPWLQEKAELRLSGKSFSSYTSCATPMTTCTPDGQPKLLN